MVANPFTRNATPKKIFEYKILSADTPTATEEQLNEFGKDGWQLIQILDVPDHGWHMWFIREKSK